MNNQDFSIADFAAIDVGDPVHSSGALLAFLVHHKEALKLNRSAEDPQNIWPLEVKWAIDYHILRIAEKRPDIAALPEVQNYFDAVSNTNNRDTLSFTVTTQIGVLAAIALKVSQQEDDILDSHFKLRIGGNKKIDFDDQSYYVAMRCMIGVVPAKKLRGYYKLCRGVLENDSIGGESKKRARGIYNKLITEIENRSGVNLSDFVPFVVPTEIQFEFAKAFAEIETKELTAQTKKLNACQVEAIHKKTYEGLDALSRKMDEDFARAQNKLGLARQTLLAPGPISDKPFTYRPTRKKGLADVMRDPVDVLQLLLLGEKSLVSSR